MAEVADGAGPPIVGNSTVSSSPPPIDWADVFNTTHRYGDATPPPEIDRWGQPSPPSTAPPLSPADSLATQLDCLPSHVRFTAGRVDGLRQALQALLTWPVEGREVLTTRHEPPAVLACSARVAGAAVLHPPLRPMAPTRKHEGGRGRCHLGRSGA